MSFAKVADLANEFMVKLAERHYEDNAPEDCKAKDIAWIDEETRREIRENGKKSEYIPFDKAHNPPGAIADEKTWKRAKKAVKKYWKKYEEPWAVVYDVYRKMGGKPKKKSKKKSEAVDMLIQKYGLYGKIKNTTPPQNNILPGAKERAVQAVYNLVNTLNTEKQEGRFADNVALDDSFSKINEFYHSLLQEGKRPKFDLYDQAVSDPDGFSILEEQQFAVSGGRFPTKLDKILTTKSENLKRHLNEANAAVRELKQETRS